MIWKQKKSIGVILWGFLFLMTSMIHPTNAIGFSDSENDVLLVDANEKGDFFAGIDIVQVFTYGSTIVIQCKEPIPVGAEIFFTFLVMFTNDKIEDTWDAAIRFIHEGPDNLLVTWIVGDPIESAPLDWNTDHTGSYFSVNEIQLTLIFTDYEEVSTAEMAVDSLAEIVHDTGEVQVFQDWAPDYYQPVVFGYIPPIDTTTTTEEPTTTPTTSIEQSSTETTTPMASTTSTEQTSTETTAPATGFISAGFISTIIAIPILVGIHKRKTRN